MTLEETPLFKKYDKVMELMYELEDISCYGSSEISMALDLLQKVDIKAVAEDVYFCYDIEVEED